jgi:molybdopterin-guanine dinucleotide biosynthesis protein A
VGFAQGLAQVRTDWVLLLACDLPGLKAAVLQTWVQELAQVPETAVAYLPRHPKGWEPLCGFYRRRCLSALTDFIAAGGRSFQTWLSQQLVQELVLDEVQVLFNCNTPHDLDAFEI